MSVKSLIRLRSEVTESAVSKMNCEYELCGSVTWGYKCKKFVEYGTQSHEITCQRHEHRYKGGVHSLKALQIPAGLNVSLPNCVCAGDQNNIWQAMSFLNYCLICK